ncbi:MAG: HesB/IscA family protein [Sphingomonadales bacterium]
MAKPIMTLTKAAADRISRLLAQSDKPAVALRLVVSTQGCSGLAYAFDFAEQQAAGDETVIDKGATIFVDPDAVKYVSGSEMDFVEDKFTTGFVFRNPNEKGRCGCGESFYV